MSEDGRVREIVNGLLFRTVNLRWWRHDDRRVWARALTLEAIMVEAIAVPVVVGVGRRRHGEPQEHLLALAGIVVDAVAVLVVVTVEWRKQSGARKEENSKAENDWDCAARKWPEWS